MLTDASKESHKQSDVIIGTAELANISGESSVPMAIDELDIADKMSAISMTEEDQRQVLEKLENLRKT